MVIWPQFITNVAEIIASQSFKDRGSIQNEPIRIGTQNLDGEPIRLGVDIPYVPFVTPSGRRDWGQALAAEYISAVSKSQTPVGAMHVTNPAADFALKEAYGEAFEILLRDGDLDFLDTKDADGNIIKVGKESSEAFADLCPDPIEIPDPIEEEKKRKKAFNAFLEKYKDQTSPWKLHEFMFSEFHCIEDGQPQDEIEKLIATKLIREFEAIIPTNKKIEFYDWILRLGSLYYAGETFNFYYGTFRSRAIGAYPFFNVSNRAKADIITAGYDWQALVNNVSQLVIDSISISFPIYTEQQLNGNRAVYDVDGNFTGYEDVYIDVDVENIYKRIQNGIKSEMIVPWPYTDPDKQECPLSKLKIQVSYTVDNTRPKLLTNEVIALFTYTDRKKNYNPYNWNSDSNNYLKHIYYDKKSAWIKTNYEDIEYKRKWNGIPSSVSGNSTLEQLASKLPSANAGTQFKNVVQNAVDAKKAADICDENETDPVIDYIYPSGDPYEKIAEATIAYWYAHLVQPFAPSTSMPPALIPPPLGGIYVPVYYGGMKRLAKGIRRALNSGKTYDKIPATQPPAITIATALAAVYAKHLLEFKLIYLGGIPTPGPPIPMVGFVPLIF